MSDQPRRSDSPRRAARPGSSRRPSQNSASPRRAARPESAERQASPRARRSARPAAEQGQAAQPAARRQQARETRPVAQAAQPAARRQQAREADPLNQRASSRSASATATRTNRRAGASRRDMLADDQQGERGSRAGRRGAVQKKKFNYIPFVISGVLCALFVGYFVYGMLNKSADKPTRFTTAPGAMDKAGKGITPSDIGVTMDSNMANPAQSYHNMFRTYWKNSDDANNGFVFFDKKCRTFWQNKNRIPKKGLARINKIYSTFKNRSKSAKFEYYITNNICDYKDPKTGKIFAKTEGTQEFETSLAALDLYCDFLIFDKQKKKASKVAQTMFRIAYQMTLSKASISMRKAGFQWINSTMDKFSAINPNKKSKYNNIASNARSAIAKLDKFKNALWEMNDDLGIKLGAGDLFNIAANHKDPAVRCTALLLTGLYRIHKSHAHQTANVEKANEVLQNALKSSDPAIKNAAKQGLAIKKLSDFIGFDGVE